MRIPAGLQTIQHIPQIIRPSYSPLLSIHENNRLTWVGCSASTVKTYQKDNWEVGGLFTTHIHFENFTLNLTFPLECYLFFQRTTQKSSNSSYLFFTSVWKKFKFKWKTTIPAMIQKCQKNGNIYQQIFFLKVFPQVNRKLLRVMLWEQCTKIADSCIFMKGKPLH